MEWFIPIFAALAYATLIAAIIIANKFKTLELASKTAKADLKELQNKVFELQINQKANDHIIKMLINQLKQ